MAVVSYTVLHILYTWYMPCDNLLIASPAMLQIHLSIHPHHASLLPPKKPSTRYYIIRDSSQQQSRNFRFGPESRIPRVFAGRWRWRCAQGAGQASSSSIFRAENWGPHGRKVEHIPPTVSRHLIASNSLALCIALEHIGHLWFPSHCILSLHKSSRPRPKGVSALECWTGGWVGRSATGRIFFFWNPL